MARPGKGRTLTRRLEDLEAGHGGGYTGVSKEFLDAPKDPSGGAACAFAGLGQVGLGHPCGPVPARPILPDQEVTPPLIWGRQTRILGSHP